MVGGHRVLDQPGPLVFPAKRVQRPVDRGQERGAVVVREHEAVSRAERRIEIRHAVLQTTGGPHNGDRAVPKAVKLVEARRLVARRHQEGVGARLDLVR